MDLGLMGRTALITGSSRGIGKSCAIALAREGCHIILCARNIKKLVECRDEIVNMNFAGRVDCGVVDATSREDIKRFMDNVSHIGQGNLDILVNNVGGGTEKALKLWGLTEEQWINAYKLNTLSMQWFTEFAATFLERSDQARIINISTKGTREPGWNNPQYNAAKSAMDFLTKRWSNELAPKGICVNAIAPHSVICDTWERDIKDRAQTLGISVKEARETMTKEVVSKIPMGRQGTDEDVANWTVFLASKQANFITGQWICLDGGSSKGRIA